MDESLHSDSRNTIERMGVAFERARLPRIAGRMLAYLLLSDEPRTLDELAEGLRISRSSASTDARLLERLGSVERVSVPGDRRDYYRVSENVAERMWTVWLDRLMEARDLLLDAQETPEAEAPEVGDRLRRQARELEAVARAVEGAGRSLRGDRDGAGGTGEARVSGVD